MKSWLEGAGNGVLYVLAYFQSNEVFQIIELISSIVLTVLLVSYRLWKWYKEAKQDGKISKDEIDKGIEILGEGLEELEKKKGDDKKDDRNWKIITVYKR